MNKVQIASSTSNSNISSMKPIQPFILVIFGITGDLAKRKVLPAIYHLLKGSYLPKETIIVGSSRQNVTIDQLFEEIKSSVLQSDKDCDLDVLNNFKSKLRIIQFNPINSSDYHKLHHVLSAVEKSYNLPMNKLFYLSIPPEVYPAIIKNLGKFYNFQHNNTSLSTVRLLVEKPFGYDLSSAKELIQTTSQYFDENQLYRIDHYLAKESAQNILTFRKYNPIFSHLWNGNHIISIEVHAYEKITIEGRAHFYEKVGALRDLIQSHLIQLLTLATLDIPTDINNAQQIHLAKQQFLNDLICPDIKLFNQKIQRGQYQSYRQEVNNQNSMTETYAKVELRSKNPKWANVPFILTTGKALAYKETAINIVFGKKNEMPNNKLTFQLQPNESINIILTVKEPGFDTVFKKANMTFSYLDTFHDNSHPDAYERVLMDAARGDQTLFATSQEVLSSWQTLQPILNYWYNNKDDLLIYPNGSLKVH